MINSLLKCHDFIAKYLQGSDRQNAAANANISRYTHLKEDYFYKLMLIFDI